MTQVAKRAKGDDHVLPVTKEWVQRVVGRLESEPRGAQAKLAADLGMSTGALADLLAVERDGTPKSKYSKWVKRINDHYGWPSMLPLSQDAEELRYLLDGMGEEGRALIKALAEMTPEERAPYMQIILGRKKS